MKEPAKHKSLDLIKTIEDDEEVECFSEESDDEVMFQPRKQKNITKKDFDTGFQFVASTEEYNEDTWNDLNKYIKRKAKSKTDDKIKKAREKVKDEEDDVDENVDGNQSDVSLSDDELKHDDIKVKESRHKKKQSSEIEKDAFFEDIPVCNDDSGAVNFYKMNLSRPLMKAIGDMKFVHPTPIQAAAIPVALLGRDICGCAATGTGKTAAYMLPTLERLLYRPAETAVSRVLVLVPTRELGVQVYQVTKQLTQYTNIEVALAVGGLDLKIQENVLRRNPDVVIATPGRLIDHLKSTPTFGLDSIEVLILDEADRMLDEYFAEQMNEIIKQCSKTRQTMLFSATMTDEVKDLATVSLDKPVRLFVDSNQGVAFNLRQEFVRIRKDKEGDREPILAALVCRTFRNHCIIFVQTKKQAHRLHILLGLLGVKVVELHGNLSQPQRLEALAKFKKEEADIMIATDVAARGLDIVGVQTVINFTMPATLEHYIHRVGRTARAGRAGVSVSLAGELERKMVKQIVKQAKSSVKSRLIPNDILDKYKKKLVGVEDQLQDILREEMEERFMSMAENKANRADNILKGVQQDSRPWFQSKDQRRKEKERLSLTGTSLKDKKMKGNKDKKGKGKNGKGNAPDSVRNEMDKVALLQARAAKRKLKPKKMNAIVESQARGSGGVKRKSSNFTSELTDTSKKGAKKLRYDANVAKKMQTNNKKGQTGGKKGGAGGGKSGKMFGGGQGKAFGKPQQKKKK
ncbi:PREDICTED: probable ATP-dependent RNA helicase DDX27 [Nicrophorus vespilloides]|uniref:RNA helicase n=1 Tax=Nicrophorus vespilloides TaxID=110193 RepID=A0ABM1MAI4_NICVS|nr:PREDICTED: probable ATP-dependent RNA helicase DDX27 [Nicrophorus vespilloides]